MRLAFTQDQIDKIAARDPRLAAEISQTVRFDELQEKRAACAGRGGLINFIRLMWPIIEPSRPLVEGWVLEAICEHLEAVTFGDITRLLINVPPGSTKSLTACCFWPAWEWGPSNLPSMRYICASYNTNLTRRDNIRFRRLIQSSQYRELWGDRFGPDEAQSNVVVVGNNKTGWKMATSVGATGTGARGDRFVVDDGNNPMESESPAVMDTTLMWFTEVVPDRLNDLDRSAIINIQQRTNEGDISGIILTKELPYEHLCIPMEYDPQRHCVTSLGWEDPRGLDESGQPMSEMAREERRGWLAWPERFSPGAMTDMKIVKGDYAWCTPGESPILMGDLSLRPISQVKVGEKVIGFTTDTRAKRDGEACSRRKLTRATVLSISTSVQEVVKMRLSSGRIIRCTRDHKWYTGRNSKTHRLYKPAKVGSKLFRVCDPEMPPVLKTEQDWRDAGWLAGFFDGEGSVAFQARRDGDRSTGLISFSQGTGRNLPLCEKLERLLTKFGFEYRYNEFIRSDRVYDRDEATPQRWYTLRRNGLPTYQKFLHIIQPTKWRDRLLESGLGANFCIEKERVISIEPDGFETVYGLETTTGNYVVWGIASSNSGQYQQQPTPRGGGIFKRDWIEPWPGWNPDGTFRADQVVRGRIQPPALEYVCGWVDTAFTDKQENDFCAMVVLGVFRAEGKGQIERRADGVYVRVADELGFPKVIVLHAWKKRLTIHGPPEEVPPGVDYKEWRESPRYRDQRMAQWGLVEWVADTVGRFKIDYLGIETQAAGHTLEQELYRLHSDLPCTIELIPARGDKVARGYAVQGSFSSRQIYFPTNEDGSYPTWLTPLADDLFVFPKGQHDDLVDALTGGIKHLRDNFLFERRESWEAEEERSMEWGRNKPVALPYDL